MPPRGVLYRSGQPKTIIYFCLALFTRSVRSVLFFSTSKASQKSKLGQRNGATMLAPATIRQARVRAARGRWLHVFILQTRMQAPDAQQEKKCAAPRKRETKRRRKNEKLLCMCTYLRIWQSLWGHIPVLWVGSVCLLAGSMVYRNTEPCLVLLLPVTLLLFRNVSCQRRGVCSLLRTEQLCVVVVWSRSFYRTGWYNR